MSVLARLIGERERYARRFEAAQARRRRIMAIQYALMLVLGAMIVLHYNKIVAALIVLIK